MKKLTVIALSLLAAGAAMAEGLSREQVVAELVRARNSGELIAQQSENAGTVGLSDTRSTQTRAAVLAEYQRARAAGELARSDAESYGIAAPLTVSTKTRAEVLAELQAARASGELDLLNSNNPGYAQLQAIAGKSPARELLAGEQGPKAR